MLPRTDPSASRMGGSTGASIPVSALKRRSAMRCPSNTSPSPRSSIRPIAISCFGFGAMPARRVHSAIASENLATVTPGSRRPKWTAQRLSSSIESCIHAACTARIASVSSQSGSRRNQSTISL